VRVAAQRIAAMAVAEVKRLHVPWDRVLVGGFSQGAALAPHVSVYCLTYEPETAFAKRVRQGLLVPVGNDAEADCYVCVQQLLAAAGFTQYEVSSHARPGHAAVHNRLYWAGACTLGLGPSAVSYLRFADGSARRWRNMPDAAGYCAGKLTTVEDERYTPREALTDRLFTGIRDMERGVDLASLEDAHGVCVTQSAEDALRREEGSGAVERVRSRHYRLTRQGACVADRVARGVL
jgi:oxygen-independent coproporphyrinogen-3 oxidase